MKNLYVLVGVPGSGKSTWVKNQDWLKDCAYISTDMWIDMEAERTGKTYSDVFTEYMPKAIKLMTHHVELAKEKGMDIVWDQTSTTVGARAKKLRMCPDYNAIAIVFKTPDNEELQRRLSGRVGKNIPWYVQETMASQLKNEPPTLEEGFTEIWEI